MLRKAQFSGNWYPGNPGVLRADLTAYLGQGGDSTAATAVVAPHAGYMYSGPVAGAVYARVLVPETVVVLAVNHRGIGARAAVLAAGSWETPLGEVPIEEDFVHRLLSQTDLLREDARAHEKEHSLEMQLPFLQQRNPGFRLVPVCLQQLGYPECLELGQALARTVQEYGRGVLLVASTDMTHFESLESARKKDALAIQRVLDVDPEGLYRTVQEHRVSMCGYIPTTAVLCACRVLGASRGELVRYATSGDISGDFASVVGYAGILLR